MNAHTGYFWTDAEVSALREHWAQNKSSREIARAMGMTEKQIVNKVSALRLPTRLARVDEKELTRLFVAGYPPTQIAVTLGCSRNSVHRVIARLGLKRKYVMPVVMFRQPKPKPQAKTIPEPIIPVNAVTLEHRTGCCWPVNDGGPFLFCNEPKQDGTSYCEFHNYLRVAK